MNYEALASEPGERVQIPFRCLGLQKVIVVRRDNASSVYNRQG